MGARRSDRPPPLRGYQHDRRWFDSITFPGEVCPEMPFLFCSAAFGEMCCAQHQAAYRDWLAAKRRRRAVANRKRIGAQDRAIAPLWASVPPEVASPASCLRSPNPAAVPCDVCGGMAEIIHWPLFAKGRSSDLLPLLGHTPTMGSWSPPMVAVETVTRTKLLVS